MDAIVSFLKQAGAFYLATAEGDQPRVRPFGAVARWEDKIYLITGNQKDVYRQLQKNPKVELCAMVGRRWMRLTGALVADPRREARAAFLDANPELKERYSPDDGRCEVFYFVKGRAIIQSLDGTSEEYTI